MKIDLLRITCSAKEAFVKVGKYYMSKTDLLYGKRPAI
jgi:hypothetical protein